MEDNPNETQRQIDGLQHQVNNIKETAQADKETRRAEMGAMRSDLAESLARSETANKEGLAKNREAIESLRVDMTRRGQEMGKEMTRTIILTVGVGFTILGVLITVLDIRKNTGPVPAPVIIQYPYPQTAEPPPTPSAN